MDATIRVVDLLAQVQLTLVDTAQTRFSLPELQTYLNAAYREIVNIRPDASTDIGVYTCVPGVRQDLTSAGNFPNAVKLVEVYRNLAAESNQQAVIQIERKTLDDQRRGWPNDPVSLNIEHFIYDPRVPWQFLVYPPAAIGAQLEVAYSVTPLPHALSLAQLQNPATPDTINLVDAYANACLEYIKYQCYTKDAGDPSNAGRAVAHFNAFNQCLGGKTASDKADQPGAA